MNIKLDNYKEECTTLNTINVVHNAIYVNLSLLSEVLSIIVYLV